MSPPVRSRAVIVGVQLPGVSDVEHASSLEELERLATTLGLEPVGRVTQRRAKLAGGAVLGDGKLKDLAAWTGGTGVIPSGAPKRKRRIDSQEEPDEGQAGDGDGEDAGDGEAGVTEATGEKRAAVVVVDHDLTPSQLRNLERATDAEVLDRTSVILSIFQRHARTREARVQVEIARLNYIAPRLREVGAGQDRQRGGIGGKGAGESSVELDRRKIRDRIAELRSELVTVQREAATRRSRRAEQSTIALVGYTNAGKSSLMRALTGSEPYVANKLFATLDTTVRVLVPETRPRILVSDTVGFIKKLPHDLVASFRSTLEEAREAHLLVHVVDASDAAFRTHMAVTTEVLSEIGANDAPALLVLNKADRLDDSALAALALEHPDALILSAHRPEDVGRLHAAIIAFFERDMIEEELLIGYDKQRLVHEIHESCRVLSEGYEDTGTRVHVRAPAEILARLRAAL